MRHETRNIDCYHLLQDLRKLQRRWERKIPDLTQRGQGPWANCVLFAIEIALHRIEEDCPHSFAELNTLLKDWEHISKDEKVSSLPESTKGIDFGIGLVIRRVRQLLLCSIPRKQPTSANGGTAPGNSQSGALG